MEEDIKHIKSPLKEMPECWKNDTRMNVLFAPFRKRDVNPLNWDSKMAFWKESIDMWASENSCTFSILQLQQAFQRKGKTPSCIATVFEELLRNGEIMLKSNFLQTTPTQNQTWASWTVRHVIKTPVSWAFEKMKNSLVAPPDINFEAQYVHLDVLKKNGEKLIDSLKKEQEELFSMCKLKELLQTESDEVTELTIHWLELKGLVAVIKHDNTTLVKIFTNKDKKNEISEVDLATFTLQQNERALTKNLEQLELEKQNTEQEARSYLKKGMRQMAKSCLRRKKALEKCIDKQASALENVQTLLTRIKEAESDSKVLDSYKLGLSAMKSIFKESGLTEDGVSSTMSHVQEVLDIHDEIQAGLAEPVGDSVDADLENELASLLADIPAATKGKYSSDIDLDLPEVPISLPTSPVQSISLDKKERQKTAV